MASLTSAPGTGGAMLELVEIRSGADVVKVNLHGATLVSWTNEGEELIFVSEKAVLDNVKAIRGGIPVVFPHFGPWSQGPNHGFARILKWTCERHGEGEQGAYAVFTLRDSDATRAMWAHAFALTYTVTVGGGRLHTALTVENKGEAAFDFEALLHTYIRVPAAERVRVSGLQGLPYTDKVRNMERGLEQRDWVPITEFIDRVYEGAHQPHTITRVGRSRDRTAADHSATTTLTDMVLTKANFPDTVVWNPWEARAKELGDLGHEEYKVFVCVEAGAVAAPVTLAPGAAWHAAQELAVTRS